MAVRDHHHRPRQFDRRVERSDIRFGTRRALGLFTGAGSSWAAADVIRARLAATGRDFGDSAQDIRADRDR
jgi:hypothetical protein